VALDPPDADESDVFIPKVGTPPAPRQMEFHNLYPGREYKVRYSSYNLVSFKNLLGF